VHLTMRSFPITKSREKGISSLCTIKIELLAALQRDFLSQRTYALSVEEIAVLLKNHLTRSEADAVSSFLLGMRRNADRYKSSGADVIGAVTVGLREAGWDEAQLQSWQERQTILAEIIDSPYLKIAAKASTLYYLHSKHIHSMRIITELRPIFDDDRATILSYIIKNQLHLVVSDKNEKEDHYEIPIGIDELQVLQSEIDNAIKKTEGLKNEIEKRQLPLRVYRSVD
jgi:hypothetical protein